MSWFKRQSPKHPQEIRVPAGEFLGEQDGPTEQLLKDRLSEFFKRDRSVYAAYLARVSFGGQTSVALCLKTQFGPDRGLAEKIGAIFKTIFNAEVHLDIMFPSVTQEAELAKVCRPFFTTAEKRSDLQQPDSTFGLEACSRRSAMSACEAMAWLEGELNAFPERAGGEELYRFFVRITGKPLSTYAEDRRALVDALHEWLGLRTEPRTMLAVEIAAAHGLSELRPDIERLLSDVKAGKAFLPFYSQTIEKALQRMLVAS